LAEVQVSEGKLTNAISARLAELETARVALAAELSGVAQGLAAVQSVLGKMIGPLWPIRKAAALVRSLRGR
jgi:hypothetical protein